MRNVKHKNVLFINYGGIGDEILFLPCIQGFKKQFPDSKITLCLEPRAKGIKGLTDDIDEIIEVDIKAKGFKKYLNILYLIFKLWFKNFDIVISSGKSPFVSLILILSGIKTKVGYKTKFSKLLTYEVELNENTYAGCMYFDLIKPLCDVEFELPKIKYDKDFKLRDCPFDNGFILVHPGVSLMSVQKNIFKCPNDRFWIDTILSLLNMGKKIVLAGGPDDKRVVELILKNDDIKNNPNFYSAYMETKNLYEMAGLIKKADSMLCCDSAPLHLGVSLESDLYAIFGPTNEVKLVPEKENIKVIAKKIKCRPCLWHKRQVNCEKSDCLNFTVEDVLNSMK